MSNIIKNIIQFNKEAGLLDKGMDSFMETAYTLEESVEGFEAVFNGQHEDGWYGYEEDEKRSYEDETL